MKTQLGHSYRDVITGFAGVATGRCEYITGCHQVLLQPRALDGNKKIDSEWFDEQRVEPTGADPMTLDNGSTPGADRPAPRI